MLGNARALSGRAFWRDREVGQGSPRAFDKAVWAWPPVGAVDAGPVEIQLTEGMVLRCPEAAPRSTTHYAAYPEIPGYPLGVTPDLKPAGIRNFRAPDSGQLSTSCLPVIRSERLP